MVLNARTKGASGEREIADMLNFIIYTVMKGLSYPEPECLKAMTTVQRNQNQSAVGGNDLTNVLGLSIEVKRQENLSVPAWWRQCVAAAERNKEVPVLIYRQNRKAWHIRTLLWVQVPGQVCNGWVQVVGEMELDGFKAWFAEWVKQSLLAGAELRR
jgi:hypothetical protein